MITQYEGKFKQSQTLTQKNDSGKKNSYVKVKNLPTDNIHR